MKSLIKVEKENEKKKSRERKFLFLTRGAFRTQSNIYDGNFLLK